MKFDFSLNRLNPFLCIALFCIAYTIFDIAGSVASLLNKTGGGIISDSATTSSVISTSTKRDTNTVIITINLPQK